MATERLGQLIRTQRCLYLLLKRTEFFEYCATCPMLLCCRHSFRGSNGNLPKASYCLKLLNTNQIKTNQLILLTGYRSLQEDEKEKLKTQFSLEGMETEAQMIEAIAKRNP